MEESPHPPPPSLPLHLLNTFFFRKASYRISRVLHHALGGYRGTRLPDGVPHGKALGLRSFSRLWLPTVTVTVKTKFPSKMSYTISI